MCLHAAIKQLTSKNETFIDQQVFSDDASLYFKGGSSTPESGYAVTVGGSAVVGEKKQLFIIYSHCYLYKELAGCVDLPQSP